MTTILTDSEALTTTPTAPPPGLWLTASEAERVTGWRAKPEGMCQDDHCVPLAESAVRSDAADAVNAVDIEAFWRSRGAPVVRTDSGDVWILGTSADARQADLASRNVPELSLPDLNGVWHSLADLRGRKVFLVTWASW